ncbi:hypothetical protein RhiirA1_542862 [Rhizophagus irregularis]|uniref:Uncharacterized protein n=1 Tax=Rhizophagus irregularis TaxID=588596 RepID=A0A2I1FBJ8_9GLOM|nr:hypothetical protein RhiirA1_543339 [Rhizophagus irregularis]PKC52950.1 hypothetical protein RhiirA1_543338 [Rhizophagus irregularis]PKC53437.1 hypothetical protein RhiirA1_543200 [Rhizophagus irregularis]PKC54196.1 hypothetical protein RhiirA1_542969 [Rhizophagus irregularis]PKC54506.1 hypothetical protein RhiirA1_542862 [Rhizophagus irregularis]
MVRITHSKSYNSNKTNNTTSKNKTMHKRQRISNSTIEESNNARNDLLDDPPLDEFIMDINTPHNSTSFNNESLEESDKSPIKKDGLSESQSRSTSFNNIISTDEPLLTNASALNEVKTLDYITHDLILPHYNQTNFTNEINFNALEASTSYRNGRGHEHERECGYIYGHGRGGFGRRH